MDDTLKIRAKKLNIPIKIQHNGEDFFIKSIEKQKKEAKSICNKMFFNGKRTRSRIHFINNKYVVYGEDMRRRKKKKRSVKSSAKKRMTLKAKGKYRRV